MDRKERGRVRRSPSSRGRGLKLIALSPYLALNPVALFTRAWIEIFGKSNSGTGVKSRPLHEGVD